MLLGHQKKKMHYHNLLSRSRNKVKTMWNFVKVEINKQNRNNVPPLNIDGSPANDYQELARVFNDYFINVSNQTQTGNLKDNSSAVENLNTVYIRPFGQIDLTSVTAQEINRLINSQTINYLGHTLDYTLSWIPHIARIGNKLRTACYILRILKPILIAQNLQMIYFAYFHSIMSYGIIF